MTPPDATPFSKAGSILLSSHGHALYSNIYPHSIDESIKSPFLVTLVNMEGL